MGTSVCPCIRSEDSAATWISRRTLSYPLARDLCRQRQPDTTPLAKPCELTDLQHKTVAYLPDALTHAVAHFSDGLTHCQPDRVTHFPNIIDFFLRPGTVTQTGHICDDNYFPPDLLPHPLTNASTQPQL